MSQNVLVQTMAPSRKWQHFPSIRRHRFCHPVSQAAWKTCRSSVVIYRFEKRSSRNPPFCLRFCESFERSCTSKQQPCRSFCHCCNLCHRIPSLNPLHLDRPSGHLWPEKLWARDFEARRPYVMAATLRNRWWVQIVAKVSQVADELVRKTAGRRRVRHQMDRVDGFGMARPEREKVVKHCQDWIWFPQRHSVYIYTHPVLQTPATRARRRASRLHPLPSASTDQTRVCTTLVHLALQAWSRARSLLRA